MANSFVGWEVPSLAHRDTIFGPLHQSRLSAVHLSVLVFGCHDRMSSALQFTLDNPPVFVDMVWEVCAMITAWNSNMNQQFSLGYVNCLDESMSLWTNQFTCPGFMFVPSKPWPFGNEYHLVCCCLSGIMWGINLVEGKERLNELGKKEWDEIGPIIGLLLLMLASIFNLCFMVILDSGFCVLKAIIELCKKGVFASALIKK